MGREMGATPSRPLASVALLGLCVLAGAAALAQGDRRPERCTALIEAFDDVVVTALDHRLLAIEDVELAEARALRRDAEADCTAGRYRFGLRAIEEALRTIGVSPIPEAGESPN